MGLIHESHAIVNVPQNLVDEFIRAFPNQTELCECVQRGMCDNVEEKLRFIGEMGPDGDYTKLNDEQNAVVGKWWNLYYDVWNS